jgi:hypothetical protein
MFGIWDGIWDDFSLLTVLVEGLEMSIGLFEVKFARRKQIWKKILRMIVYSLGL